MTDALDGIREAFGESEEVAFVKLSRACAGLMNIAYAFHQSPTGSPREEQTARLLDDMLAKVAANPEKAQDLIMSLLSILAHIRRGGTLEQWFGDLGIDHTFGKKAD